MIILTATIQEAKYLTFPTAQIGVQAKNINSINIKKSGGVILFGSCGLLHDYAPGWELYSDDPTDSEIRVNELIAPCVWAMDDKRPIKSRFRIHGINRRWIGYTAEKSIKKQSEQEDILFDYGAIIVDQESYLVAELCNFYNVSFISIRYVIDKCSRRVMMPGINHFWRIMQHKRMQRKFDEIIRKSGIEIFPADTSAS